MSSENEEKRFLEYIQRQLIRPGSEPIVDGEREWFEANRERFREQILRLEGRESQPDSAISRLERALAAFEYETSYDSFFAAQIFQPILDGIKKCADEGGLKLKARVKFSNSPGLEPSAAAWPSEGGHILLAGRGTFSFCNYWGKAFIHFMMVLPEELRRADHLFTEPELVTILRHSTELLNLFVRLALYCAAFGSVAGFGRVAQPEEWEGFRIELVTSTEAFIIGHEYGHFLLQESYPDTGGVAPGSTLIELERQCDIIGLSLSIAYGTENDNIFAFQGVGASVFFHSLFIVDRVQSLMTRIERSASETHPNDDERMAHVEEVMRAIVSERTRTAVQNSMQLVNRMADAVLKVIESILQDLLASANEGNANSDRTL